MCSFIFIDLVLHKVFLSNISSLVKLPTFGNIAKFFPVTHVELDNALDLLSGAVRPSDHPESARRMLAVDTSGTFIATSPDDIHLTLFSMSMSKCSDSGELFMVDVRNSNGEHRVSECLYERMNCNALLWVENGYIATIVEKEDGKVLKLEDGRLCYQSTIQYIPPTWDLTIANCHSLEDNKLFACNNVAPEAFAGLEILRCNSEEEYEIYETHRLKMQNELTCISNPKEKFKKKKSNLPILANNNFTTSFSSGFDIYNSFVIGTRKSSVEILSKTKRGVRKIACGDIDCAPEDVRLVCVHKFYVLAGLRDGTLLLFEWTLDQPTSPTINMDTGLSDMHGSNSEESVSNKGDDIPATLKLIARDSIRMSPILLVPLGDKLDADIIALSDRPWLLHVASQDVHLASISYEPFKSEPWVGRGCGRALCLSCVAV
ncbi:splicing factor 3B subunit 3 isoform X4 [Senna tora]|uniref:Splicing factor 3B subunit 3 isoform X4 n=1 Tax=Senna tora TaxID=362788 RepID=A0A834T4H7_9FABA|nr:splicing factor 3B subunit 3 isoform X4 [Senna tora]